MAHNLDQCVKLMSKAAEAGAQVRTVLMPRVSGVFTFAFFSLRALQSCTGEKMPLLKAMIVDQMPEAMKGALKCSGKTKSLQALQPRRPPPSSEDSRLWKGKGLVLNTMDPGIPQHVSILVGYGNGLISD